MRRLSLKSTIKGAVNRAVSPLGIEISLKNRHDWSDTASFIPLETTLKAARDAGLSVGDYIDGVMNKIPGATQATIDRMSELGVFSEEIKTVVEIGPGSGRYLEKTLQRCRPTRYEIYETAKPWADYVASMYPVIRNPTDGRSLASTATNSVDLIQAHKVFSGIPFLPTTRYWREMARVTRPGGFAVFDIVTEACMDPETVMHWASSELETGSYPAMMPREVAVSFFSTQGFRLSGSFFVPMGPGKTETFIFRKSEPRT